MLPTSEVTNPEMFQRVIARFVTSDIGYKRRKVALP